MERNGSQVPVPRKPLASNSGISYCFLQSCLGDSREKNREREREEWWLRGKGIGSKRERKDEKRGKGVREKRESRGVVVGRENGRRKEGEGKRLAGCFRK